MSPKPRKPKSKSKPSPNARASLDRFERVHARRLPYLNLSRRIVSDTLARYLPQEGSIVEIGAGDGQLYERLPPDVRTRILYTEPNAAVSRPFRKAHPELNVMQASAEHLPVGDGEAAAVLGFCVMDVVPNGPSVAKEIARVLRPGGRFIHWLDMSTVLEPVVADLAGTDLVPFPNVFTDPTATEWPEDLFLVPRQQVALIVSLLNAFNPALAQPLHEYLSIFSTSPLKVASATAELIRLQESAELRSTLKAVFRTALDLADHTTREQLSRFQGQPVSSARHFEKRLLGWFDESLGYQTENSGIRCEWEYASFDDISLGASSSMPYRSLCAGEERVLSAVPERTLCTNVVRSGDESLGHAPQLVEHGMFVFVASRI